MLYVSGFLAMNNAVTEYTVIFLSCVFAEMGKRESKVWPV